MKIGSIVNFFEDNGCKIKRLEISDNKLEIVAINDSFFTKNEYNGRTKTVSFTVPPCDILRQHFDELTVKNECVQLFATEKGEVIWFFENILFESAIDKKYKHTVFSETALGIYLNTEFKEALKTALGWNVKDVSLPSYDNLFNEDSKNFIPFFRKIVHRIKSFEGDTHWYWLNTPAGSDGSNFCVVGNYGYSIDCTASNSGGGVAPVFRIA